MKEDIQYFVSESGDGFYAIHNGIRIGEIRYVRIGVDKIIIDYTGVEPEYQNRKIGLSLVRNVANLARAQHRRVIAFCPFARAMFNRYSEFDDIRLLNAH